MGDSAMRQQQLRRRRLLESTSDSDESEDEGQCTYDFEYDRDVQRRGSEDDCSGPGGDPTPQSDADAERLRLLKTSPPYQDCGGDGPSGGGDSDGRERLDDGNATTPSGGWNGGGEEAGEGEEKSGEASTSRIDRYFAQMNEMRRDAWDRLYENTVDGPCQQTCQALAACEQNLEANFNEINCRQLMFFNFPRDPNGGMGGPGVPGVHHAGAGFPGHAAVPRPCEYCHQMECEDDCDRPELFFLNKKPPFATNHDEWDEDDYPIDKMAENGGGDSRSIVRNEAGWMSGFF